MEKLRALQFYNLGRHSVKFSVPLLVTLRQTVTELCTSVSAAPVYALLLRSYLIVFCSRSETTTDVISGKTVQYVDTDVRVSMAALG